MKRRRSRPQSPAVRRGDDPKRNRERPPKSRRRAALLYALGLIAGIFAIYGQTARFDFVNFDDDAYIYANPAVQQGLTGENLKSLFVKPHAYLWHPLATLTHLLDVEAYHLWAGGHHLTNVALHALAALLLFRAFTLMTGRLGRSALLAAIFALHPLRVESVAWVCERKDVLSGAMFAWLLILYTHFVRRPTAWRFAALFGVYLLGSMSKPMFVTTPCVLLLLHFWPLSGGDSEQSHSTKLTWRRFLAVYGPMFAVAAAVSAVTVVFQRPAMESLAKLDVGARLANAVVSYLIYLRQFLLPISLTAFYPHRFGGFPLWEVASSLALLAAISAAAVRFRKRVPYVFVGWFWYLGMLVPVIGLLQAGRQAHADRFTYLPQIGLALIAAWGGTDLADKFNWSQRRRWCVIAPLLLALSILSWRQTTYWADGVTLFTRVTALTQDNSLAHNNLGIALDLAGRPDEALEQFRLATEADPGYASAFANYGDLFRRLGRFDEAIKILGQARSLNPADLAVVNNLGECYLLTGRREEAQSCFADVLERNPRYADARINLGLVREQQGRPDDAIAEYRQAVVDDPTAVAAYANLAIALHKSNQRTAALDAYRRAIELRPDHAETLKSGAWLVATTRGLDATTTAAAVEWAARAVELGGKQDAVYLDVLAASLAAAGRYAEAVRVGGVALKVASDQGNTALAAAIAEHLARYRAGIPISE